jgi:hypothetical protein
MAKTKKSKGKPATGAKKGAAKKPPAKKAAKKAAPKQAAKKAAPKKAAPRKAAPKKAAPKAKPAKQTPQLAIDFDDEVPTNVGDNGANGNGGGVHVEILAMARVLYGNKPDAELLAFDPNDIDALDPSIFYELIQERYGVQGDESNSYFSGFGGPIKNLIAFVTTRWDGKTNNPVEMPPADYLEEVVHEGD